MRCSEAQSLFSDYLDERLKTLDNKTVALETHLGHCSRCADTWTIFQNTVKRTRGLPTIEPPASLAARVQLAVKTQLTHQHTSYPKIPIDKKWFEVHGWRIAFVSTCTVTGMILLATLIWTPKSQQQEQPQTPFSEPPQIVSAPPDEYNYTSPNPAGRASSTTKRRPKYEKYWDNRNEDTHIQVIPTSPERNSTLKTKISDALGDSESVSRMSHEANAVNKTPADTPPTAKPTDVDKVPAPSPQPDVEQLEIANLSPLSIESKTLFQSEQKSPMHKNTTKPAVSRHRAIPSMSVAETKSSTYTMSIPKSMEYKDLERRNVDVVDSLHELTVRQKEKKGLQSKRRARLDPIIKQSASYIPNWARVQLHATNILVAEQPTTWFISLKSPSSQKNLELWAQLPHNVSTQFPYPAVRSKLKELHKGPHGVRLWEGALKPALVRKIKIPLNFKNAGVHELSIRLHSLIEKPPPVKWNVICPVYQGTAIPTKNSKMRDRFNFNGKFALIDIFRNLAYASGQIIMLPATVVDDFVQLGLYDGSYDEVLNAVCRQLGLQSNTAHGVTIVFRN